MDNKENNRSKNTVNRLLGGKKTVADNIQPIVKQNKEFNPTKKNIQNLIREQGSSKRKADSIRINPILTASLKYWTTMIDSKKSKPDIIEEALIKLIPEEYLIEGYKLFQKNNKDIF